MSFTEIKKFIITSNSAKETLSLGKRLGKLLEPKDNICLYGDLGAGKTCFTQGIAQGLGIVPEEYVRSSTFVLFNEYRGGRIPLYHFDFFRIEDLEEIIDIGFEEYLFSQGVTVVEWAEKFPDILPEERLDVGFWILDLNTRKIEISISHPEKRYTSLLTSFRESNKCE